MRHREQVGHRNLTHGLSIGIDGPHGSGKTTFALALTASLREQHINAGYLPETARTNAFVEDIVIHRTRKYDVQTELHLLGSQMAEEQLLRRHYDLVVCDRTVLSIATYVNMYLMSSETGWALEMSRELISFCSVYARGYSAILHMSDQFDLQNIGDRLRSTDSRHWEAFDTQFRSTVAELHAPALAVPLGLSTSERVKWALEHVPALQSVLVST